LDPARSSALLSNLPIGQAILTTAGPLPPDADPAVRIVLTDGELVASPI